MFLSILHQPPLVRVDDDSHPSHPHHHLASSWQLPDNPRHGQIVRIYHGDPYLWYFGIVDGYDSLWLIRPIKPRLTMYLLGRRRIATLALFLFVGVLSVFFRKYDTYDTPLSLYFALDGVIIGSYWVISSLWCYLRCYRFYRRKRNHPPNEGQPHLRLIKNDDAA